MSQDQLFKDLLHAFFREFMELFFPEVAKRLDFDSVTFLERESFTDVPKGRRREVDIAARVSTADGSPEIILVHVEVQGPRKPNFPFRMWEYYSVLRLRHRVPVFPVALYLSPGSGGLVRETYTESLFGEDVLVYHYHVVGLPDLDARDYLGTGNPLGYGLAALMRRRLPGWELKLRCAEGIAESDVDEARQFLLLNLVETFTQLPDAEEVEYQRRLHATAKPEVVEMVELWSERIKREGMQQGMQQGMLIGKRDSLLQMLRQKFGDIPENAERRVRGLSTVEEADRLLSRVLDAKSLSEMGLEGDSLA